MDTMNVAQTVLKTMFNYPRDAEGGKPHLWVSNSYISNGYTMITHNLIKNHEALIKSKNQINYFFNIPAIRRIGTLPTTDSVTSIPNESMEHAAVPKGETLGKRHLTIENTGILINIESCMLQVWAHDNGLVFFNNLMMTRFKFTDKRLHGWNDKSLFMDTSGGDFMIAFMPSSSNVLDGNTGLLEHMKLIVSVVAA